MTLKEAKKLIDSCKEKLNITVARDYMSPSNSSHQAQSSISTTGAVNNFYKGLCKRSSRIQITRKKNMLTIKM